MSARTKDLAGKEFIIERTFDAPREIVFRAWTDPQQLMQWWGPRGFTNPVCEWDARPGKQIHVVMCAPNGTRYPMAGEFREVIAPEKLVFTSGALDENGKLLFEFLHTATFVEQSGKTKLTLRSVVTKTTPDANKYIGGFEAGMTQSLERLSELLEHTPEPLIVERILDAPVSLVWQALTDRDKISQWSCEMKEFKAESGFEFEFYGTKGDVKFLHHCKITEAVPNKKLAYTWRYEGYNGNSLVTFELFSEGNKTRVRVTHEGLETFPPIPDFARQNFMEGWTYIVGTALKGFVEGTPLKNS
jgi:uncharacterized protein YndB with AHSA1/START domain